MKCSHLNGEPSPGPRLPPPLAGAAEVAPGVQIALQTSPQRPRTQPPPGGPSGKLERDSVCRPPWGGSGGGEGRTNAHAPSPALPAQTRGGGGARPTTKPRTRNSGCGAGKGGGQEAGSPEPPAPCFNPFYPKTRLSDHPGSRGQSRARLPTLQIPVAGDNREQVFLDESLQKPRICWFLLAARGTSPTPRTPSDS